MIKKDQFTDGFNYRGWAGEMTDLLGKLEQLTEQGLYALDDDDLSEELDDLLRDVKTVKEIVRSA